MNHDIELTFKNVCHTLEDVRLESFNKFTLQNRHLNQLAKTHSKDRVLQVLF